PSQAVLRRPGLRLRRDDAREPRTTHTGARRCRRVAAAEPRVLSVFKPDVRRARSGAAKTRRQGRSAKEPDARPGARSAEPTGETSARRAERGEVKARLTVLACLVCVGGLSIGVSAVQQGRGTDAKTVTLQKIKDNLYLATGGGGNSAVFVTDLGVVIVDTK